MNAKPNTVFFYLMKLVTDTGAIKNRMKILNSTCEKRGKIFKYLS